MSESTAGQSPIIEWTADYRLPPAFDAMLWVPGYVVTRRGRFAVPVPISTAIALERGADRPERLPPAQAVELQTCTLHLRFATPETHRTENAEGLVILRARVREFEPRRTAIVALDGHGDELAAAELPNETPYSSPERWGWLIASPIIDVLVLPVNVLLAGTIVVLAAMS